MAIRSRFSSMCRNTPLGTKNSACSSELDPTMISTSVVEPAAIASIGRAGTTSPSMCGSYAMTLRTSSPHSRGSGCLAIRFDSAVCAAVKSATGTEPKPSTVGSTPRSDANAAVTFFAVSSVSTWCPPPLCRMARQNSPFARGIDSSVPTLIAPADSPAIVT